MSKKNTAQMLDAAKADLSDKHIVAFIGKSGTGKTVTFSLLNDELFNEFLPKNRGKFTGRVIKGYDALDETFNELDNGRFPHPTVAGTRSEIIVEIKSKALLGNKIKLFFKDISGEDIEELLQIEHSTPKMKIDEILNKFKEPNEPYGPLSYLIFAKVYVILIDADKEKSWKTEQIKLEQTITSIKDIKNEIGECVDEKFTNPLAIVFSKADLLNKSKEPKGKSLSAEDLVRQSLPRLDMALEDCHGGPIGFFKFGIDDVQKTTPEEAAEILALQENDILEKYKIEQIKQYEISVEERNAVIEKSVNDATNTAKQNSLKTNPDEIVALEASIKAGNDEQIEAEEKYPPIERTEFKIPDELKKDLDKVFKIKMPLKYSKSQYGRFISWMLENMS